jgi:hypothetical protein
MVRLSAPRDFLPPRPLFHVNFTRLISLMLTRPLLAQHGDKAGATQPQLPAHMQVPSAPLLTADEAIATFRPGDRLQRMQKNKVAEACFNFSAQLACPDAYLCSLDLVEFNEPGHAGRSADRGPLGAALQWP